MHNFHYRKGLKLMLFLIQYIFFNLTVNLDLIIPKLTTDDPRGKRDIYSGTS